MTEQELRDAMDAHGDTVYRLALCRLQDTADAEDVYQDVFLRLLGQEAGGWDGEHLKAWLIRTALNRCADLGRLRQRRGTLSLDEVPELAQPADEQAAELWDGSRRSCGRRSTSSMGRAMRAVRSGPCWASRRRRCGAVSAGPGRN